MKRERRSPMFSWLVLLAETSGNQIPERLSLIRDRNNRSAYLLRFRLGLRVGRNDGGGYPLAKPTKPLTPVNTYAYSRGWSGRSSKKKGLRRGRGRHKTRAARIRVNGPAAPPIMRGMIIPVASHPPPGGIRCRHVPRRERGKKSKDSRFLHDLFPFCDHGRV